MTTRFTTRVVKQAAEATWQRSLQERLQALAKENLPKGLPEAPSNSNITNKDNPETARGPEWFKWHGAGSPNAIAGTGSGGKTL